MQTSLYKWASLVAQLVKNLPAMPETPVQFLGQEDRWRRDQLPTPVFLGFPGAQTVKNPPVMQETWVQSLGWKDPLEKGMATPSSILAWRIPWGCKDSDMTFTFCVNTLSSYQVIFLMSFIHLPII